jgi:RimJ/RimL family protein N-acetyltransferase
MNLFIREARVEDSETILSYTRKLLAEEGHNAPFAPGEFSRSIQKQAEMQKSFEVEKNSVQLLAFKGDTMVGEINCQGMDQIPLNHVTILSMSVDSQYRSCGIGTRLMQAVINWVKENDQIKRVELYTFATNTIAHRLYRKFGFRQEGIRKKFVKIEGRYIDDVIMARLFLD